MTIEEKKYSGEFVRETYNNNDDVQHGTVTDNSDDLQRHLGNRQIQLIAIGGSIGTALFVSIGGALTILPQLRIHIEVVPVVFIARQQHLHSSSLVPQLSSPPSCSSPPSSSPR